MGNLECCTSGPSTTSEEVKVQNVGPHAAIGHPVLSESDTNLPLPAAAQAREPGSDGQSGKQTGSDGPAQSGKQWVMELDKSAPDSKKLGIDVDPRDNVSLVIQNIRDGLVQDWNAAQMDASKRVVKTDRVVEVNGVSGNSAEMLRVCQEDPKLTMKLQRS
eukprot:gnl/MRDRNA2_/MRDRNA2_162781_c0_seq1.p1 gnl/MRDRNA2_/MRDRNA2_162781_c0~~gnl/MRDRNA2_/MRDRNA2_162781_c0_seq1.p1  ORF type:complete len:183 (+),score=36.93 gnl/MRDRNA2_/MRDRNA2_162781_c0_seq1:69-551(+)